VRKLSLSGFQMSAVAYVERAAWWSRELIRFRSRGPGDVDNAMRAVERDYGIDYWLLWRLRYRCSQIRDIGVSCYARLEAAYYAECDRQRRKLAHEVECARKVLGPDHPVVASAARVVGDAGKESRPGDAAALPETSGEREA